MTLSELITILQAKLAANGDLPVFVYDSDLCCDIPLTIDLIGTRLKYGEFESPAPERVVIGLQGWGWG